MPRNFFLFLIRRFVRRASAEHDLAEELESHLAMDTRQRVERGESSKNARDSAMRSFGNIGMIAEVTRDMWGFARLEEVLQDGRYALRILRKSPGFTTIAVLILALGIGANAAIFTLVNAVLLQNLPVADPNTLVRLGHQNDCCVTYGFPDNGDYSLFGKQTYLDLKESTPDVQELAAIQAGFGFRPIVVRADGRQQSARSVMGEFVSGNYFRVFGIQAHAGRLLDDDDDRPGAPVMAVLSYESWQAEYAGNPAVVGSTFWVNTKAVTIAGVAPRGFYGDRLAISPPEFFLPINSMQWLTDAPYVNDPGARWLYIMGRLKPGVNPSAIEAKLNVRLRHSLENTIGLQDETRRRLARAHVILAPGGAGIRNMQEAYASNLRLLLWTSGIVLLIACANLANLMLVRGMGRRAEISIRAAVGAKRGRILGQLLTESVLLSLLGGAAGLCVAYGGTRVLLAMAFPGARHLPIEASPSAAVLGFGAAISVLTGIIFGIAPAWIAAHAEPVHALRSGGRATSGGSSLLQRGLVALQIALSLVLLIGAGLFGESLNKLRSTDLRVETKNRYIVHINPQAAGYSPSRVERLYQTMEERFHSVPGIEKVGISSYTPMEDNNNSWGVQIQGRRHLHRSASFVKANDEYFASVGTRLLTGRGIEPSDTSASRSVAVVNESFVRQFFKPNENPIGHHFGQPGPDTTASYEIVGVVADTAYTDVRSKHHPMYFVPLGQRPLNTKEPIESDDSMFAGAIVLETAGLENGMESIARRTLAGINPNLAVVKFQSFSEQISDRFIDEWMIARLTMFFGGLALLLSTVGLYGVTAYTVARRTSEIGLRMALGAKRSGVVAMVLRGAMTQTAVGLALGIPAALVSVRLIKAQLYEVRGADTGLLAISVFTLLLAAGLAALIPARRAASTDPTQALRTE